MLSFEPATSGSLLGREQCEGRDTAATVEPEQIVQQRACELGVVRKDATEDEVVLEIGKHDGG